MIAEKHFGARGRIGKGAWDERGMSVGWWAAASSDRMWKTY